jgi:uncharacterized protein YndB with AHSA1/START domain
MDDLVYGIEIRAPLKKVWEEITRLGTVQPWYYKMLLDTQLAPGAKLRYYSPDRRRVFILGEVVESKPPYRLVHTHQFTELPGEPTLVTWQLDEISGGVRVTVTHSRYTDQVKAQKKAKGGWPLILESLKATTEGQPLPGKMKMVHLMMRLFMFMAPRAMLVENVERRSRS